MESCVIRIILNAAGIEMLEVVSDTPARAITLGQIVALYDIAGAVCYGGGAIEEAGESYFQSKRQFMT